MIRYRMIKRLLIALVTVSLAYLTFTAVSIWRFAQIDETRHADVAIVLGAAVWEDRPSPVFEQRIRHGIRLYNAGTVTKLLFTGGVGAGKDYSEASVAQKVAMAEGIPPAAILIEDQSRVTRENLEFAQRIMARTGLEDALIVSDPLHMKRAMLITDEIGLKAYSSPTPTSAYRSIGSKLAFLMNETRYVIGRDLERLRALVTGHRFRSDP